MIYILGGLVAFIVAACGGETNPSSRKRPEHPDDGTPPFEGNGGMGGTPPEGAVAQQAKDEVGQSFDLYVHAAKESRKGCGIIHLEDLKYASQGDEKTALLNGTARWFSTPPMGGVAPSEAVYRSGDFPISSFTSEYPEYGTLGLKYLATGSYDIDSNLLKLKLQNIDADTDGTSPIFLGAVYDPWADSQGDPVSCLADEKIDNEFFVAVPAQEAELVINNKTGQGAVCNPCEVPVDSIMWQIP